MKRFLATWVFTLLIVIGLQATPILTESFDNVTAPNLPTGWTGVIHVSTNNTTSYVQTVQESGDYSAHSNPNVGYICNGGVNGQPDADAFVAAVSPLLQLSGNPVIHFYAKGGNSLQVGWMTNYSDTSSYTNIQTIPLNSNWAIYSVNIQAQGNGYLAFKNGNETMCNPVFVDSVSLSTGLQTIYAFEGFEGPVFPPTGWSVDAESWHLGSGIGWAYEGNNYIEIYGNNAGKIKTPQLVISAGDSISFYTKHNGWEARNLTLCSSIDGNTWEDFATFSVTNSYHLVVIDLSSLAGYHYLAFSKSLENNFIQQIDAITMPPIYTPTADVAVINVNYPINHYYREGNQVTISAKLKNRGNIALNNLAATFRIDNTVFGTINNLSLNSGDSTTVESMLTLPQGRGYHTILVQVTPEDDNNINNAMSTTIQYFAANQMVEGFEGECFPPLGWTTSAESEWEWYDNIIINQYDGGHRCARILGTDEGTLITPKLLIEQGDSLSFYAENVIDPEGNFLGDLEIRYSTDGANWTTFTTITPQGWPFKRYAVDLSSLAGEKYIGFYKNPIQAIYLDYVVGPDFAPLANDDTNTCKVTVLTGNYPNPFNPTTTIAYSVSKEAKTAITLYNVKGQKVRTLVNETQNPGQYKVTWNGTDEQNHKTASGIYFVQMQSGNYRAIHKMLMLK